MNMRKAAHPSGGMGSSNPCRWRGEWLHHGGGVCLLFVQMCRLVWSSSLVVCRQVPQNNLKDEVKNITFCPTLACTTPVGYVCENGKKMMVIQYQ